MGYYAGGYYAGGYYAGGIFGSIGKVFGTVARAGVKLATGGIAGLATGGLKGAVVGTATAIPVAVASENTRAVLAAGGDQTALTPALIASHNAALARGGNAVASAAKPSTGLVPGGGGPMMTFPTFGGNIPGMPRGFHVNRSTYVVRGGGTSHHPVGLQVVLKGTSLAKNRRMNWGNGRALVRAERRIGAFLHHATKYMKWAHPSKAGGHAVPKFPKRRKK